MKRANQQIRKMAVSFSERFTFGRLERNTCCFFGGEGGCSGSEVYSLCYKTTRVTEWVRGETGGRQSTALASPRVQPADNGHRRYSVWPWGGPCDPGAAGSLISDKRQMAHNKNNDSVSFRLFVPAWLPYKGMLQVTEPLDVTCVCLFVSTA